MITTRRVTIERCNGCHSNDDVVEFKIGCWASTPVGSRSRPTHRSTHLLVRLCFDCREMMRKLSECSLIGLPPKRDAVAVVEPWPNTENTRARQAAGRPVPFLHAIQARPPELDEPSTRKVPASTRKTPPATRKKPRKSLLDRVAVAMVGVPAKKARK